MNWWIKLKPATKITSMICVTVVLVSLIAAAAYSGCFDMLLNALLKAVK